MKRIWQLILTRILYWRVRLREQETGVTHGLLLKMGKILDYDARAQALYLAAGRRQDKAEMAYYEGQRRLVEWILDEHTCKLGPTRPRDGSIDGPGNDSHA